MTVLPGDGVSVPTVTASCSLCAWAEMSAVPEVAKALAVWHVYEEHPLVWLRIAGDREPLDPDPRTPAGLQKLRAGEN